jgi:hypothetical protein
VTLTWLLSVGAILNSFCMYGRLKLNGKYVGYYFFVENANLLKLL